MGRLHGKRALVTGGTRGIGRAMVERFAAEGATVVTCGRRPGFAPFNKATAIECLSVDVTDAAALTRLVDHAVARLGGLDILVNNAGIEIEARLEDTSDAQWDAVLAVNVTAVFRMTRAAVGPLRAAGGGTIVNIASSSAVLADPNMAAYNTSKSAVIGLTRSTAVDHGRDGIRCNAIAPGWIETEMVEQAFAQARDPAAARAAAVARHPVGRIGRPADIAAMAVWLASDESGFATGQIFTVDGGLTAVSPVDPASS